MTEGGGLLDAVREMNQDAVGLMRAALATNPPQRSQLQKSEGILRTALSMLASIEEDSSARDFSAPDAQLCTALTLNNIACVYRRQGREEEALAALNRAARTEERGAGHPSCSTLCNLCTVLVALGRADEGIPIAARCVKLARAQSPGETPDILVVALHNHAMALQHSSHAHNRRHAPATMSEALAESRRVLGEAHPTTVMLYSKCGLPPSSPEKRPVVRAPAPPTNGRGRDNAPFSRPRDAAAVALRNGVEAKTDPMALSLAAASAQAVRASRQLASSTTQSPVAANSPQPLPLDPALSDPTPSLRSGPVSGTSPDAGSVLDPGFSAFGGGNGRVRHPNAAALLYATRRPRGAFPPVESKTSPLPTLSSASVAKVAERVEEEERNKSVFLRHLPITTQTAAPLPVSYSDIRNELLLERRANEELARLKKRQGAIINRASPTTTAASAPLHPAISAAIDHTTKDSKGGLFGASTARRRAARLEEEAKEEQLLRANRKRMDDHLRQEHDRRQKLTRLHEAKRLTAAVAIQRAFRSYWRNQVLPRRLQGVAGDAGFGAGAAMVHVSRAVVRCARTWLRKTAGRRLLLRIARRSSKGGAPQRLDVVQRQVLRIQCAFRMFAANRFVSRLQKSQAEFLSRRRDYETRVAASGAIQSQYRRFVATTRVTEARAEFYTGFVLKIQKVVRQFLNRKRVQQRRRAVLEVEHHAATQVQRMWRGYQGRVSASIARIRNAMSIMKRRENRHTHLLSRVFDGFRARVRCGRVYNRSRRQDRQHAEFMAPVQCPAPPPQTEAPLSPYAVSALGRSDEVGRILRQEYAEHTVELFARPMEQRYLDELLEEHCAPTQTQVLKLRAQETLQRDLELATVVRFRACVLIQRAFRAFVNKMRTCPGALARLDGHRLRAQQASLARRALQQREEQAYAARIALPAGDLAAGARSAVRALKEEVAELAAQVRIDLPAEDVRSIRTRTADARLCRQMEDELEERAVRERVTLRQAPAESSQPFLTARQQLRRAGGQ